MDKLKIRTAILSVYNKEGIVDFARGLSELGIKIISTGKTANILKENGIQVQTIEQITEFPEMLEGRVKTLHPKIHGGILAKKDNPAHIEELKKYGIEPIDLVCVNLYPFREVISRPETSIEEAIENIDIGGPTMIRAAAKNYKYVAVVSSPKYYDFILQELQKNDASLDYNTRALLAKEAFKLTAEYDIYIQEYLEKKFPHCNESESIFPASLISVFYKAYDLRYGENPHQKAALFYEPQTIPAGWSNIEKLSGKELSFNNIVDANAALELIMEFTEKAACCIIKHTNPCGAACDEDIVEAYRKAYLGEPNAAMGGIIAFNRTVDKRLADAIVNSLTLWGKEAGAAAFFAEIIIAPDFTEEALDIIRTSKKWGSDTRLLKVKDWDGFTKPAICEKDRANWDIKRIRAGLLLQTPDSIEEKKEDWKIVSRRKPTEKELKDLHFAYLICKHVKSNAIVVAKDETLLGTGAGQMSRVNSTRLAIEQAGRECKGAVLASDAFFPFRDSIDYAHSHGITAVIEPGGSKRDNEVIEAADQHNMVLIFTGIRHFKH